MIDFLRNQPFANFNMGDSIQETPLFRAIHYKDFDMVKYLVGQCGADLSIVEV